MAAQHTSSGVQLGLLDWKGPKDEHHVVLEGARADGPLQRDGYRGLPGEVPVRADHREERPSVDSEARQVGSGAPQGPQALRPLSEVPGNRARAAQNGEGGERGAQGGAARGEEGEVVGRAEAETAAQEIARFTRGEPLTLGGFRPGTGYVILPAQPAQQLWWKPCLKRDGDGTREHCWFLAPTTYDSWFCWGCKAELGL